MTDEERRNLCKTLRNRSIRIMPKGICETAADEIERLAALLEDYRLTFGDVNEVKWIHEGPQC